MSQIFPLNCTRPRQAAQFIPGALPRVCRQNSLVQRSCWFHPPFFFFTGDCVYLKLPQMTAYTTSHTVQKACKTKKGANNIDMFFFFLLAALLHFHCFVCTEAVLVGKRAATSRKTTIVKTATWATLQSQKAKKKRRKKKYKNQKLSYIHISLAFIQNYCRHYKPRSTPWPSILTPLTTNLNKSQNCELKCHATTAFTEGQNIHRLGTSCTVIERLGESKSEKRPGHVTKYHTSTINAVTLFLPRLVEK